MNDRNFYNSINNFLNLVWSSFNWNFFYNLYCVQYLLIAWNFFNNFNNLRNFNSFFADNHLLDHLRHFNNPLNNLFNGNYFFNDYLMDLWSFKDIRLVNIHWDLLSDRDYLFNSSIHNNNFGDLLDHFYGFLYNHLHFFQNLFCAQKLYNFLFAYLLDLNLGNFDNFLRSRNLY